MAQPLLPSTPAAPFCSSVVRRGRRCVQVVLGSRYGGDVCEAAAFWCNYTLKPLALPIFDDGEAGRAARRIDPGSGGRIRSGGTVSASSAVYRVR